MKPSLVSHSDLSGGAARAAFRLLAALRGSNCDAQMQVRFKSSDTPAIAGPASGLSRLANLLRGPAGHIIGRTQRVGDGAMRSGNWLPSRFAAALNASNADLVNLHWVGGETLSIEDIGRIRQPVVWTLHDMWPFSGGEHYGPDDAHARWRRGYTRANRPSGIRGLDLDRLVWERKGRAWRRPIHVVAPSQWLAECARGSALFKSWPISVIPNPLDTTVFRPHARTLAREILGLPDGARIVLFGALGGTQDPRKGGDLLLEALRQLAGTASHDATLGVIFGQSTPAQAPAIGMPLRWMGHLSDDVTLSLLYSAADVMVVPSRQENLPQTATEAQACGCPVVAFNCTGLPDAVVHQQTGMLVPAFDTGAMAQAIALLLSDASLRERFGQAARARAEALWTARKVAAQYLACYEEALGSTAPLIRRTS
jgi:glycosyltransferase involved in cell wall biosynthesis